LSHAIHSEPEETTQLVVDRGRSRRTYPPDPSSEAFDGERPDMLDQYEARSDEIRLGWVDPDVDEPWCFRPC